MLSVVTWLWSAPASPYGPGHVNRLASALRRHLRADHVFTCVTDHDDLADFDSGVRTYPMVYDHAAMRTSVGSCFRRLALHGRELSARLGGSSGRVLQLDLDTVIVGDVTALFDRPEPLVLHAQNRERRPMLYNPSVTLMTAGVLHEMWELFHADPEAALRAAKGHHWEGSDMAIVNDYVSQLPTRDPRRPASWSERELVAYWRLRKSGGALPTDARMVLFYGSQKPDDSAVQARSPWVAEHWR